MTILGKRFPLPIEPYVNPLEDSTQLDTIFFTDCDKVRFQEGKLRKINGWQRIFAQNSQRIVGGARNIFSYSDGLNNPISIIGTSRSLYALVQSTNIYNITPLQTTKVDIPAAFTTEYNASVSVNVITTNGSPNVTLDITNYLNNNDEILISGVTGTINGIPGSNFNGTFNAYVISNSQIQINVDVQATSSGTVAVTMTWATSYVYANVVGFGGEKGDRIKILASSDVGNITAASINIENIISNVVNQDIFVFQTTIIASSHVTGGGGADTTIQFQIPAGNNNQSIGFGYGGGQYGAGQYGDSAQFTDQTTNSLPRIWSMDKFVDSSANVYVILTPGDAAGSADASGANVYSWQSDVTVAPVLVDNAPYFVNWLYVSHNIICTLGGAASGGSPSQGIPNNFISSDVGSISGWTPGPSSYSYAVTIADANALISQANTRDVDLIFTNDEVIKVTFVDKPNIWLFEKFFTTDGVIAPKARAEIQDRVFWQGEGDFFSTDGTSVEIIPNNTLKRYVYDNINAAQDSKCFAYANTLYNEVWFFWVYGQDTEPNNYAMCNYKENTWALGTLPRTASEEPLNIQSTPLLIESNIVGNLNPTSVSSYFMTLGTNPLTTTLNSKNISFISNSAAFLTVGDFIKIAGATTTNGIPLTEINGVKQITGVVDSTGEIIFQSVSTNATSSGTGGGSSVTVGTAVIGLNMGTNVSRLSVNEPISLFAAPSVGGITASQVNSQNTPIRAISGSEIQINDASPETVFSTSTATVTNTNQFFITYNSSDRLFQHEAGLNDYNSNYVFGQTGSNPEAPMLSYVTTNMAQIGDGDETMVVYSVFPDTNQQGNLELTVQGRLYAQSSLVYPGLGSSFTITPTTTKVDLMLVARQRQYTITSNVINGDFLIGKWYEEIKPSSTR